MPGRIAVPAAAPARALALGSSIGESSVPLTPSGTVNVRPSAVAFAVICPDSAPTLRAALKAALPAAPRPARAA